MTNFLTPPSLSNPTAATPFWCPSWRIDTVSIVVVSHTQMKGFFPVCPVATIVLSGWRAKLLDKNI